MGTYLPTWYSVLDRTDRTDRPNRTNRTSLLHTHYIYIYIHIYIHTYIPTYIHKHTYTLLPPLHMLHQHNENFRKKRTKRKPPFPSLIIDSEPTTKPGNQQKSQCKRLSPCAIIQSSTGNSIAFVGCYTVLYHPYYNCSQLLPQSQNWVHIVVLTFTPALLVPSLFYFINTFEVPRLVRSMSTSKYRGYFIKRSELSCPEPSQA
jgi:hypothetical protein